jgi:MYXO-CTERM domain-containing protein
MQINSGGNYGIDPWTWSLTIDVQEATNPVAEPAGLGLVGMALLGLRKRRS